MPRLSCVQAQLGYQGVSCKGGRPVVHQALRRNSERQCAAENGHDRQGRASPRLAPLAREQVMASRKVSTQLASGAGRFRHARRRRGGARPPVGRPGRYRLRLEPHAFGHRRMQAVAQVREPAVHGLLQGARRAQPAAAALAQGEEAGRDRHVGRQSRAGRGLPRQPPRRSPPPSSCPPTRRR